DAAAATSRDATQPVARRVAGALDPAVVELVSGTPDPRDLTKVNPPPIRVDRPRALYGAWYELFPRSEGGFEGAAKRLRAVADAEGLGLEVALDYALQCSPDHPWVREHPEWFHHRPDGSIKYAENPPKKYQDIYPINFWPDDDGDRIALWEACREVLEFWIAH